MSGSTTAPSGASDRWRPQLFRGSAAVVINVAVQGAGGFTFWTLAARRHAAEEVGSAQALFTSLLVVTWLSALGLPFAVARHCRDDSRGSRKNFALAAGLTSIGSLVAAAAYIAWDEDVLPAADSSATPAVFVVTAVGMSLAVLVEVRLMALRKWRWVVGRAVLLVVARLPVVLVVEGLPVFWLFVAIAGTPALSGFIGATVLIARRGCPRESVDRREASEFMRSAAAHLPALLASQAPNFLVPFVVAGRLDAAEYASFYLAWGIAMIVAVVPHMLGQTLLVEAFKDDAEFSHQVRVMLGLAVGTSLVATLGAAAFSPLIPRVLGPEYEATQRLTLILVGAAMPWAVTAVLTAAARAQDRHTDVLAITLTFCATALASAWLFTGAGDVVLAGIGWVVANTVAAGTAAAVSIRHQHQARSPAPRPARSEMPASG